jgi:hypothetical protein
MMARLSKLAAVTSIIVGAAAAFAAESQKDWPCVQVKVPDISPAMMWSGPALEGENADWRKSPEAAALASKLVVRRYTEEEVAAMVSGFAAKLKDDQKSREMTRIFAAAFESIAAERREVIAGIERFTRRQRELAGTVNATRREYDAAKAIAEPTPEQVAKRDEILERLNWETRIFDDREKSTTYACEIPTLLEQRLFLISRELAKHMG